MALAFFDLDNTLVAGDTAQAFSEYIDKDPSIPTPEDFLDKNHSYMDEYDAGTLDLADYMRYTLSPLMSLTAAQVQELIQSFIDEVIVKMALPKANALIEQHLNEQDQVIIISATGTHLVAPIANYLGVSHALGVDIDIQQGQITGEVVGVPTFKQGKVTRALAWAEQHGYDMKDAYFYSDSHNDLPLLEQVTHPVAVDPDPTLKQIATQKGWPIVSLR